MACLLFGAKLLSELMSGFLLTHWGRVTHLCVSKLTAVGPDNGLSPGRRQAIIWTNAGILLNESLGTTFSELLAKTHTFSFKNMRLKMSSGKRWPFCLGLNVLTAPLMDILHLNLRKNIFSYNKIYLKKSSVVLSRSYDQRSLIIPSAYTQISKVVFKKHFHQIFSAV